MRWGVVAAGLGLVAAITGCGSTGLVTPDTTLPAPSPSSSAAQLPTLHGQLVHVSNPGEVTDVTRVADLPPGSCHTRDHGQLPDPDCTPGSVDPKITAGKLCDPAYSTRTYRPSSSETARVKYAVAGEAYGQDRSVSGELDHLVNLDLAGSNDLSNLWIEAGPIPNEKDQVERRLHVWVCEGSDRAARLVLAQLAIARDWRTAEAKLGA